MRLAPSPWIPAAAGHPGRAVTPTRLPGLAASLRRWARRWRDALRAERPDPFDAVLLRDLGLSHAAAAHTDPHAARRRGPTR